MPADITALIVAGEAAVVATKVPGDDCVPDDVSLYHCVA